MTSLARRASFLAGARAVAPIMVGIVPFGLLAGATAVAVGIDPLQAVGMSVFIFAGASQLAAIDLVGGDAPAVVVVATVLIINLRMSMYSASLAPYFDRLRTLARVPLAYLLTDQAYALAVTRFGEEEGPRSRTWYYLGAALPLWVVWQLCTVVGIVAGAAVPESIPIDFAVPLTFLALLVPAIEGRATAAAAAVGGGVAVVGAGLPFNLGLVVGALCGIAGGMVADGVGDE
ncbi:AzlC family ABC transporter permease [Halomarina ordinaria]|uniref:AzlC family ABC transporter permease n=1 Tax=Halomarina ordinaria TaxID=3033939 RepID=A0ABD5UDW5_9EURY|nr:AzlC family ABC transporter permease [Halomarina sp. PSRA2]